MDKLNYKKDLFTETDEQVRIATYDNDNDIYIRLIDNDDDCAIVTLTLKEAQRLKRYLEDAITTNIINWGDKTQGIPTIATNIKTGESKEFYGVRECARQLRIDHSSIIQVIKGKRKQAGGYTFKYKEE